MQSNSSYKVDTIDTMSARNIPYKLPKTRLFRADCEVGNLRNKRARSAWADYRDIPAARAALATEWLEASAVEA